MKKKIIALLVIIAIVIVGIIALNIKSEKEVELDKSFKLSLHEKTIVKDTDLVIKYDSVSDSRCKEGWECIWAGEIEYTIKVNDEEIVLSTVRNIHANYKDYKFILDDHNESTKFVKMKITKK